MWRRLFKRTKTVGPITCPRCLGKGHVDRDDIIRLNRQGKWGTGTCAYCNGIGTVDESMISKVPADARYLTSSLTETERNELINDFKRDDCPVYESSRLCLESSFLLLMDFFGRERTKQKRVLTPHHSDFPIHYNGTEESAHQTLLIVAEQMEVPVENIKLGFYEDQVREVSTGSPFGDKIFLQSEKNNQGASGIYWGRAEDGKFEIWLNRRNLSEPIGLVATLSHEIAHIKLLGENRIDYNNEPLTDLTTVLFGLGIFNANEAFKAINTFESRGWRSSGYLSQMQWGYSLALFAHMRGEISPAWINHLTPNVKSDFLQGQRFIQDHPDLVFCTTNPSKL